MKYFIAVAALVGFVCASAPAMAEQSGDEAAIRKLLVQLEAAYNSHDEDAVAALWDDTAIEYLRVSEGREAIRSRVASAFERHKRQITMKTLEELGFAFLTQDVALVRQRVLFSSRSDADGKPAPDNPELVAIVFVKKANAWKIAAILERPIGQ